ncbi:MAG: hypothetical protein OXU64_12220 [Gemmatimonadota bacterium]|nr:hypothetical protein [Gemmatimonadota bacterium]
MDAAAKRNYRVALKQAEAELAAHEQRGEALRTAVDGLRTLLAARAPAKPAKPAKKPVQKKAPAKRRRRRKSAGAGHPEVPADTFKGMGPTAAYRKFLTMYGGSYSVPQIRDALIQGGVKSSSPTSLLTGLHSVRRRDRLKEEAERSAGQEG